MHMERKKYLIVMAGGSGTRMGASCPKQFLEIGGRAILHVTIQKFLEAYPDINVVTVLPKDHIDVWKKYCYEHNFNCRQTLVEGGITRFHSVRNGLEKVPEGALVAIHDGVRPLVSPKLIRDLFTSAETRPAVVPSVPVVDTIKTLAGEYVDRSNLLSVQTPQIFHSEVLKAAYLQPYKTSFTDDASVVEAAGEAVSYVPGERYNIKVTTPDDLVFCNLVLNA